MNSDYLYEKYDHLETDSIKTYNDLKRKRGRIFPSNKVHLNQSPARMKHARQCKSCRATFVPVNNKVNQSTCKGCAKTWE